jgi:hypothetical protein
LNIAVRTAIHEVPHHPLHHTYPQSWLTHQEEELLLLEVLVEDSAREETVEETVAVDVEDADLVVGEIRTRRKNGNQ